MPMRAGLGVPLACHAHHVMRIEGWVKHEGRGGYYIHLVEHEGQGQAPGSTRRVKVKHQGQSRGPWSSTRVKHGSKGACHKHTCERQRASCLSDA
eukprot:829021-Pelagomonas_calceolata.AAC.7